TFCKVRIGGRVVSQAIVVATGVSIDGRREILGHRVGDSETGEFWTEFLRSLPGRGLAVATGDSALGVQLVISDAHRGLTGAIEKVLPGAAWQRCRVHFMRNVLAKVTRGHAEMVAATIRTIFAQPGPKAVREQVQTVAATLDGRFPAVADMLREAAADITAFADFPEAHDEWQAADRRYLSEASMALLAPPAPTALPTARHAEEGIDNHTLKTA